MVYRSMRVEKRVGEVVARVRVGWEEMGCTIRRGGGGVSFCVAVIKKGVYCLLCLCVSVLYHVGSVSIGLVCPDSGGFVVFV